MSTLSATISADTTGFNKAVSEAQSTLNRFNKTGSEAEKEMKRMNGVTDDSVRAFQKSTTALQKAMNGTNNYKSAASKLTKELEKLNIQWNNLNSTAKKSDFGIALSNSIEATRKQIEAFKDSTEKTSKSTEAFSGKFKGLISEFKGSIGPIAAITATLKSLHTIIISTETGADDLNRIWSKMTGSFETFITMVGSSNNWSTFFNNIGEAIRLSGKLYDSVDNLGTEENLNRVSLLAIDKRMAELKALKSAGSTIDENELKGLQKKRTEILEIQKKLAETAAETQLNKSLIDGGVSKAFAETTSKAIIEAIKKGGVTTKIIESYVADANKLVEKYHLTDLGHLKGSTIDAIKNADERDILYLGRALINQEEGITKAVNYLEKAIQKDIEAYAKEYKENRIIRSAPTKISKKEEKLPSYAEGSIADLEDKIKKLNETINNTNEESVRQNARIELGELTNRLVKLKADWNPFRDMLYELEQLMAETGFHSGNWQITQDYLERALSIANKYQKKIPEDQWVGLYLLGPKEQEDLNEKLKEIYTKYTLGTKEMEDALKEYNDYISRTYGHYNTDYVSSDWWKGNIQDKYFEGRRVIMPPDRGYLPASKKASIEEYNKINDFYINQSMWKNNGLDKYIGPFYLRNLMKEKGMFPEFPLEQEYLPAYYLDKLRKYQKELIPEEPLKKTYQFLNKDEINSVAQAVTDLGSAWSNLWSAIDTGNETLNTVLSTMGSAAQDIANMTRALSANELAASQAVALGKATASASGLPFPYNLVAIGTVVATITSIFAKFASIGKFANGGIVGGNSPFGDQNIARVNSGEMILNGSQQKRLFHLLNSNGTASNNTQTVELVVRGKDLVGALDNYNRHISRIR